MPPKVQTPGVYVEEISLPPPPIAGVSTAITAFIGATLTGTFNKPTRVTSFGDFERQFGGLATQLELGYAVRQFFDNGGKEAVVVKVPPKTVATRLIASIRKLDSVDLINLLILPGITTSTVLSAAVDYCQKRRAFLIVDSPAAAKTPTDMVAVANSSALPRSSYAAVFYPWIKIADPMNGGKPRISAPSGTIAGVFAQNDYSRGVAKAPTSVNMGGVIGFETELTDQDSERLSPLGVNCLRTFTGRGRLIWGARTLASQDAEWKYIPVRRLGLYIEESISRGTQWAVFEPNGETLWAKLRASVENFLYSVWRDGGLMGTKREESFFVRCDRTTMTQDDIDNGRIIIEIGIAPVRPVEFVILRIFQKLST